MNYRNMEGVIPQGICSSKTRNEIKTASKW